MSGTTVQQTRSRSRPGQPSAVLALPTEATCIGDCAFRRRASAHHDLLLGVTDSIDRAIDLLELAVTWGELEYSHEDLIRPSQWPSFLASHRWPDARRAESLFRLAADIALLSGRTLRQDDPCAGVIVDLRSVSRARQQRGRRVTSPSGSPTGYYLG